MRPGQKVFKSPGPAFGVKVVEPGFPSAAGGWWDDFGNVPPGCCVAAYQAKGAASLAASYIDLSGTGNNCGPGVAPAWAAGIGWSFNGVNQFLVTGVIPGATYSFIIQYANAVGFGVICGSLDAGNTRFYVIPVWVPWVGWRWGGAFLQTVPQLPTGNLAETPQNGFRNGVVDPVLGGWAGVSTRDVYIGCFNNIGVPAAYQQCDVIAKAIYSCDITAFVPAIAAWMAVI